MKSSASDVDGQSISQEKIQRSERSLPYHKLKKLFQNGVKRRCSSFRRFEISIRSDKDIKLRGSFWVPATLPNHGRMLGQYPLVVLVHQWSKMGGNSQLMEGIASRLANASIPSITFDLRGVNRSTGWSTWNGRNEVRDVTAVCDWAASTLGADNVLVFGSSAGAPVAGSAIDGCDNVKGYFGVGYVFGWPASMVFGSHYKAIIKSEKPKMFVSGTKDGFTPISTFRSYYDK
eukprot:GHVU01219241.1.p1 GENE.GHVU01219241.1~~GHVU01219241.1.p1  ORF type:complete len:247 (+),score=17.44 GHVU01219241.1:46-741(+)